MLHYCLFTFTALISACIEKYIINKSNIDSNNCLAHCALSVPLILHIDNTNNAIYYLILLQFSIVATRDGLQ